MNKAELILANLDGHTVNKAEKMERSVNAHLKIMSDQHNAKTVASWNNPADEKRGYGEKRNMGD